MCKGVSYDDITQQYKGLLNVIFFKFLFIYYISLFIYQSLPIYQNELFYCLNISLVYKKISLFLTGLFFTEAELQNYTQVIQNLTVWSPWDHALFNEHSDHVLSASISRIQLRSVRNYHDGDKCCPT